ncbi:MAG TPA: type II toxin-antitoxin system VapC family toxin [Kribbellaceae bacterium]|nr:type II toxin-antitoxin system VapC family toxin [Kribbellaceae bacterium]
MICYFDTSAFVPLLGREPSTPVCKRLWVDADSVVTSRLLYVEAAAALAQARRIERLDEPAHRRGLAALDRLWQEFDVIEADRSLVNRAAELAHLGALRGYDAVHCASAEFVPDADLVVASGDRKLLAACRSLGLATADVNAP